VNWNKLKNNSSLLPIRMSAWAAASSVKTTGVVRYVMLIVYLFILRSLMTGVMHTAGRIYRKRQRRTRPAVNKFENFYTHNW